ncbi:MAG: thiol-disulfide isomerase [Acidobacteria bacterium]|nr:MAG: thiol-disulfide isomerase [Acidobacteriota bacterium]
MKKPQDKYKAFEAAAKRNEKQKYVLTLYVAGISPRSEQAIRSVKEICEQQLKDRYELEIVDIYQHPEAAKDGQIIAAPTLVKKLPLPLRRLIGDMTSREKLVLGLDLRPIDERETR